jgi:putative Mn2+ efflux pump MntP
MFSKDNVTLLITGIGLFLIPLIVLSNHAVIGTGTHLDQEWRGILGTLILFGFGLWAIWNGLTSSPPATETPSHAR